MDIDKSKTQNPWDSQLYEKKHSFVWQKAKELITMLKPQKGEYILDLGCGTGHLTNQIAMTQAKVMGIDNSSNMINQANINYPKLDFTIADGTNFIFKETFDGVFSNAALHWMKPPEKVISCVEKSLKLGGRFVAEFGGKGNIETIIVAIQEVFENNGYTWNPEINPWYFPSIGEYTSLLEQYNLEVSYAELYSRPTILEDKKTGITDWIEMFCTNFFKVIKPQEKEKLLIEIQGKLREKLYKNSNWFVDYKRIRIIAYKS